MDALEEVDTDAPLTRLLVREDVGATSSAEEALEARLRGATGIVADPKGPPCRRCDVGFGIAGLYKSRCGFDRGRREESREKVERFDSYETCIDEKQRGVNEKDDDGWLTGLS